MRKLAALLTALAGAGATALAASAAPPDPPAAAVEAAPAPAATSQAAPAAAPEAPAVSSKEAEAVLKKVQARYAKIAAFHARFHQDASYATLGQSMVADGECWFAKPGKMRWSYDTPEKQVIVSNGAKLWFHQSERGQVMVSEVAPEIAKQVPTAFLNGTGNLTEDFVAQIPKLDPPPAGAVAVDLTPRTPAPFQKLRILVEPSTHLVTELTIFDPFGNVNRLSFTEVQPVAAPQADFFELDVAKLEGVRVIEAPTGKLPIQ